MGEFAGGAEPAARWIALDPLNEVAYRRKMRAHFAAGERGQAIETYESCRAILAAELKAEPDPETQALVTRIRSQHSLPRPAARPQRPNTPLTAVEHLFAGRDAPQAAEADGARSPR